MSITRNFTLGNIYSLTPAQERMVAEINAADAKRADELAASLEQIAVEGMADAATLSAAELIATDLAGRNAALHLLLEQANVHAELLEQRRDAALAAADLNAEQARLNAHTIQGQSIAMHDMDRRIAMLCEAATGRAWAAAEIHAHRFLTVLNNLEDIAPATKWRPLRSCDSWLYGRVESGRIVKDPSGPAKVLEVILGGDYRIRCAVDDCEFPWDCIDSRHAPAIADLDEVQS